MHLLGNLYQNTANLYDFDNRKIIKDDIPFYIEYAKKTTGDILELACGTGRVTLPLLKHIKDRRIVASDLSEGMLNCFRRKLDQEDLSVKQRITLLKQDMSSFNLSQKFNLILLPWRAFQYLTNDEQANKCLSSITQHMTENSLFIFDIFHPLTSYGSDWLDKEFLSYDAIDDDNGMRVIRSTKNLYSNQHDQIIKYASKYQLIDENNQILHYEDILTYKYYFYEQIRFLLNSHGLNIIEEYGYYDKSPINNGQEFIFICQLTHMNNKRNHS